MLGRCLLVHDALCECGQGYWVGLQAIMVETVAECLLLPTISKHSACGLEDNRVCIRAWSAMLESQTRIECNPCHGMHESHAAFLAENSRPTKIK